MKKNVQAFESGYNSNGGQKVSAALSVIPGINLVKFAYEAYTGKDIVTGDKLSTTQRVLSAIPIIGTVGGEIGAISNAVPTKLARVIPNSVEEVTTLGRPSANEVFVTASSDIRGMNATQIAKRLTIPESETGFKVIEFKTTQGIATPINRDLPGFVGYGRTAGNAREFVIPNQPIPKDAKIKIIP